MYMHTVKKWFVIIIEDKYYTPFFGMTRVL